MDSNIYIPTWVALEKDSYTDSHSVYAINQLNTELQKTLPDKTYMKEVRYVQSKILEYFFSQMLVNSSSLEVFARFKNTFDFEFGYFQFSFESNSDLMYKDLPFLREAFRAIQNEYLSIFAIQMLLQRERIKMFGHVITTKRNMGLNSRNFRQDEEDYEFIHELFYGQGLVASHIPTFAKFLLKLDEANA